MAYPVRQRIQSVAAMFLPPNLAVPVKAGLAKGPYPVKVSIWLVVAMFCPPNVAVPVKAGLTRDAISC